MGIARDRLRREIERHPAAARRMASALRRIGSPGRAERLERIAGGPELVELFVPDRLPAASRRYRMHRCDGRDQVVAALERSWEDFEHPMPDAFVALVSSRGGTVLDVGANSGLYSLLATLAHRDGRAVAFEPFPPVAALLRENVAANHVGRRIDVIDVALGDTFGTAELFVPDPGHGLIESSCSLNDSFKEGNSGSVTVQVETLDRVVQRHPEWRPTVIKVDVESLEYRVLAGARAVLTEHRPLVFFEVLHIGEPERIEELRVELDYVDVRLTPAGLVVGDRVRHDPEAWNHLLVPAELLDDCLAVLAEAGLTPAAAGAGAACSARRAPRP